MVGPRPEKGDRGSDIDEEIARKTERKLKARGEGDRSVWFGLGMFGLVGWSVAVPTILGVALGLWIDARLHDRISWTLTFLIIGLALGCLNAWLWIKREGPHD